MKTRSESRQEGSAEGRDIDRAKAGRSSWWRQRKSSFVAWKKSYEAQRGEWGSWAWRLGCAGYLLQLLGLAGVVYCFLSTTESPFSWFHSNAPLWVRFLIGSLTTAALIATVFIIFAVIFWTAFMAKALWGLPIALCRWVEWWSQVDTRRDHPVFRRERESRERDLGSELLAAIAFAQTRISPGRLTTRALLEQAEDKKLTFDIQPTLKAINKAKVHEEQDWVFPEAKRFHRIRIWRLNRLRKTLALTVSARSRADASTAIAAREMDWIAKMIAAEFDRWKISLPGLKPVFGRIFAVHQQSFIDQLGPLKETGAGTRDQIKALVRLSDRISKEHPEEFVRGIGSQEYVINQTGLATLRKAEALLGTNGWMEKEILKLAKAAGPEVLLQRRARAEWKWNLDSERETREDRLKDRDERHWDYERESLLARRLEDHWSEMD